MADLLDQKHHLDYKQILRKMHHYLKQLNRDYAVPTYFVSTSLHAFSHQLNNNIPIFKRKTLTRLYHQYNQLATTRNKLKKILRQGSSYSQATYKHLNTSLLFYDKTLNQVQQTASRCFDLTQQDKCHVPIIQEPRIHWPALTTYLTCEEKRQLALNKKLISTDFYHMALKRDFVPVFSTRNALFIKGWVPCNYAENEANKTTSFRLFRQ